uniref:Uncharacterized protein n=1 Tax=Alexandrium monilatum TaxID=311494 RepID=A0A7S4SWH3_9DINO
MFPTTARGSPAGLEGVGDAEKARWWACAASVGSVVLPLTGMVLLLDIILGSRPLLQTELHHRWWARTPEKGCWIAARACGRATGGNGALVIWREDSDIFSEEQCMAVASHYWTACMDPAGGVGVGLIAAAFRPHGRSRVTPAFRAADPELGAELSVTVRGSPGVLIPGHANWDLELCGGGEVCQRLSVDRLCNDGLLTGSELEVGWPLPLCTGCGAVLGGRVPVPCSSGDGPPCVPDRCPPPGSTNLATTCQTLCAFAVQAQWVFVLAVASAGFSLFGGFGALRWGWRRHGGCAAALAALMGAVAAPISMSLVAAGDAASTLALASSTLLDPGMEGAARVRWGLRAGLVEALLASAALVATAFFSVGAQKSWTAAAVRYGPLEDGPRSRWPAVGGFLGPRPVPVHRPAAEEDELPPHAMQGRAVVQPREVPAQARRLSPRLASGTGEQRSAAPRTWGLPLPPVLRLGQPPCATGDGLNCDSLFPSHSHARSDRAERSDGAFEVLDRLDRERWASVEGLGAALEAASEAPDEDDPRPAARAGVQREAGGPTSAHASAGCRHSVEAWGSPVHRSRGQPPDACDPVESFGAGAWAPPADRPLVGPSAVPLGAGALGARAGALPGAGVPTGARAGAGRGGSVQAWDSDSPEMLGDADRAPEGGSAPAHAAATSRPRPRVSSEREYGHAPVVAWPLAPEVVGQ